MYKATEDIVQIVGATDLNRTTQIDTKKAELEAAGNVIVDIQKYQMTDLQQNTNYVAQIYYRKLLQV